MGRGAFPRSGERLKADKAVIFKFGAKGLKRAPNLETKGLENEIKVGFSVKSDFHGLFHTPLSPEKGRGAVLISGAFVGFLGLREGRLPTLVITFIE